MSDRDCPNCKYYKQYERHGMTFHSCSRWNCEFEGKETENERPNSTREGSDT